MNDWGKSCRGSWTDKQIAEHRAKQRAAWLNSLRRSHQKRGRRGR